MARPMEATESGRRVRNRLLGALPPDHLAELLPHLEIVELKQRDVLYEPDAPISHVYFPETAVLSLVNDLRQGGTVEVGTAGCEGMAGLPLFLGEDVSSVRAVAQVAGSAGRMVAKTFVRFAGMPGPLHTMLLRYTQAFLTQVAQTAACNGAHLVDQRCARWLLMTHDRVHGNEFNLTHEFLAFMLGVRRAGVTVTMRQLQAAQLIQYSRGHVRVVDREGLEARSCECYGIVKAHFERLLPAALSLSAASPIAS